MKIHAFTTHDFPAIVEIHNTIFPRAATTPEAWATADAQRHAKCQRRRWVASQDAEVVGFAGYSQHIFDYHPHKFYITVQVLPDYRRQGIGSALYDRLMAGLRPFDPLKLRADGYGNLPDGVRFLEQRGFAEVFRERPQHLDVMAFDPEPFSGLECKLRAQGIEIKTLRDLEGDPQRDRKVYDLYWEATADVPKETEIAQMDFEEWVDWTLRDPLVPHDGYFIAVHKEEYVGLSEFGKYRASDALQAGLVGVKRAYRHRGIALALQLRGIAYARANGHPLIKTSTSVSNRPMLHLYERLGFVPQPDWIQLEKVCRAE
jgi:ribosomal protein S18 acetylase RimI-like enzyme